MQAETARKMQLVLHTGVHGVRLGAIHESTLLPAVMHWLHGWTQRLPYPPLLFVVIEEKEQEEEARKIVKL